MTDGGIKSKERVAEFGEVFTPKNIVDDMLDLVKDESYRLESTFLEPACGNGNFLVEILRRKLETAIKDLDNFDRNLFIALSSTYGIDIQLDNVEESKARMLGVIKDTYKELGEEPSEYALKTYLYILDKNIIWGDALTEKFMGNIHTGEEYTSHKELKVTEWEIQGDNVKMTEYTLKEIAESDVEECKQMELTEFSEFNFNERVTRVEDLTILSEYISDERLAKLCNIHKEYKEEMKKIKAKKEAADNKQGVTKKKGNSKMISAW